METKETFKRDLELLKQYKEEGKLTKAGDTQLYTMEKYENLILGVVGGSLPTSKKAHSELKKRVEKIKEELKDKPNKNLVNGYQIGFLDCYVWLL